MSEPASGRASPTLGDRLTDDFNKVRIRYHGHVIESTHGARHPA